MYVLLIMYRSRNSKRGFPLVVDLRHKDLGAQPPAAEEFLILLYSVAYCSNY